MYYIIETAYVGPNRCQHQYADADRIDISTTPALTNIGRAECIDGWCGTSGDWAVYAHGRYATIEDAREAIAARWGEVRDAYATGEPFEVIDEDTVETYRPGRYEPMSSEAATDWVYEGCRSDIEADTSDERIRELAVEYEWLVNEDGYTLGDVTEGVMRRYRQELRDNGEDG